MRTLLMLLLIAGLGPVEVAPARDGYAPLVHVVGTYRLTDGVNPEAWTDATEDEGLAFTLPPGLWVEVSEGWCSLDGIVSAAPGRCG